MKLSDVVGAARLEVYAETGLLICVGAFVAVCVGLFWFGRKSDRWEKASRLPLESDVSDVSATREITRERS